MEHEIAHYAFDIDTAWYSIKEYAGNIERLYTPIDTTMRIHNAIGYYTDSTYYHFIKDHLGNVCAVVNSAADTVVQRTMYYASGVPMAESTGRDAQPYLYNGKEFVEAHGINTYDYGFRGYYAPIGRFTSIDPLAEQTPWQSPYVYANNDFINKIDFMGLSGDDGFAHNPGDVFLDDGGYGLGDNDFFVFPWSWSLLGGLVDVYSWIAIDIYGVDPYAREYIVIGPKGEYLGGVQNDDWTIYKDPEGKWKPGDGIDGLEPVGWTPLPVTYYDSFVGKGNPAPGLYKGQWSMSVAGLLGICLDVSLTKKVEINLNAVIDLWEVSFNGEFDFSDMENGKHSGMLGIGGKYNGFGGYFQESFKVYSGSMEYVPASTSYSWGLFFRRASGSYWDGNVTLSAALSAILGFSITISGNIYYRGQ